MNTPQFSRALLDSAKDLLLVYIAEKGKVTPSNLSEDLIAESGGEFMENVVTKGRDRWRNTVFCAALRELVESGFVAALDGPNGWTYSLSIGGSA